MDRERTCSRSASDAYVSPPVIPALLRTPEPQWTILVWDPRPSRFQLINRIIVECGGRVCRLERFSAIQHIDGHYGCNLAIIALEACLAPDAVGLEGIRSLKRKGFRVICYEERAQSWPLSKRCEVLLAGALSLLDSATREFAQQLQHYLAQLLRIETGRQDEEARVKRVMRELGSVGESQAIVAVFQTVIRVSPVSDLPLLITGETGTGKELLAHAIHQLDVKRCKGPFVALNCGAINSSLAESELFGYRRGSFTGADRDRKGLIRAAEGGVLFLDEIGELDDSLQAKLLRVLQEHRVLGIGEDREVPVSVRIIAATNRDLGELVQQKKFRSDLFHRLNVLTIHIPPLRERVTDLKPLSEHFLQKYHYLRPDCPLAVAPDFIEALAQLQLPGNARQLENLIHSALVTKSDNTPLNLQDLPVEIWQQLSEQGGHIWEALEPADAEQNGQKPASQPGQTLREAFPSYVVSLLEMSGWNLARSVQLCERLLIEAALRRTRGNRSQAARLLGITPRSVYNKIHKYQLHL
jgi:transcriptional regulator with PAS, ATPase and Fis domain